MKDDYNINLVSEILKMFNVDEIVISGITDDDLLENILSYGAKFIQINTNDNDCIKGNPLDVLPNLENYDAVFIDDDSNWYTVFNELKIISETTDTFPLVFICNNNFPNKRRDSYTNPDIIPANFRQKYINELPIYCNDKTIMISDGFYHACDENTPKNGVLTAIEDFLNVNNHIGIMKINLIRDITVLYLKSQINEKRISIIIKNIQNCGINDINLSDKLIENQLLISYINKNNVYDEKLNNFEVEISKRNSIIDDYENKIRMQNNEINLKEAQIKGFESKLNLKDSQLKNFESKLTNKDKKIDNLEIQLKSANTDLYSISQKIKYKDIEIEEINGREFKYNNEISSLKDEISSLKDEINLKDQYLKNNELEYNNQISIKNDQINSLNQDLIQEKDNFAIKETELQNQINSKNADIKHKENQLKTKQNELNDKERKLNSLEKCYTQQLSKIDNGEYCISCFKEKIDNNHLEMDYIKNNTVIRKILAPAGYLYLILKSNPKDISLNIKLYRTIKDSRCFDIGFYLNKNKDLIESKWCKYFSPELHYVCNGFDEKRTFNKKYFNRNTKKELLEYILECDK